MTSLRVFVDLTVQILNPSVGFPQLSGSTVVPILLQTFSHPTIRCTEYYPVVYNLLDFWERFWLVRVPPAAAAAFPSVRAVLFNFQVSLGNANFTRTSVPPP
jgi:hypothetical protein